MRCADLVPTMQPTSLEKKLSSQGGKAQKDFGPFYAAPTCKKTSVEIINEARAAVGLHQQAGGLRVGMKAVSTKRPFTPRDKQRSLFGKNRGPQRPPSSISRFALLFVSMATSSLINVGGC